MIRILSRWAFRLRMSKFPRAPKQPRKPNGQYRSLRDWRLEQMRRAARG